jgi:hypothetical protein
MIGSLWTFKEGANGVGPPGISGHRIRLQPQSAGFKNRINSRPAAPGQ